jgi:hypothetical protein
VTRAIQKNTELRIVEFYLKARDIVGVIRDGTEPPDFFADTSVGTIAIEVTTYHQQQANPQGHQRRVVEAAWEKIKGRISDKRENYPALKRIHVRLEFLDNLVPSTKETEEFIEALFKLVVSKLPQVNRDRIRIRMSPSDSPILHRYLSMITIREANSYTEWDWNHDFGGIGTNDDELLAVVGPKLKSYKRPVEAVEHHLVVAGDGTRISEVLSIKFVEQFADFTTLNAAIQNGPFDAVALLGMDNSYIWTLNSGWRKL